MTKKKLRDILNQRPEEVPEHPPCAFCDSKDTEYMSLFGQFLLVAQYYCHGCHSAFEWCKHQDDGQPETAAQGQA